MTDGWRLGGKGSFAAESADPGYALNVNRRKLFSFMGHGMHVAEWYLSDGWMSFFSNRRSRWYKA